MRRAMDVAFCASADTSLLVPKVRGTVGEAVPANFAPDEFFYRRAAVRLPGSGAARVGVQDIELPQCCGYWSRHAPEPRDTLAGATNRGVIGMKIGDLPGSFSSAVQPGQPLRSFHFNLEWVPSEGTPHSEIRTYEGSQLKEPPRDAKAALKGELVKVFRFVVDPP